jgi:hypothetical protein
LNWRPTAILVGVVFLAGAGSWELRAGSREPWQATPLVTTAIDTTTMTVGDRVCLTVTVEHQTGATVTWPDSIDFGTFELIDAEYLEPRGEDDVLRTVARFTLTAFELGDIELPSFPVVVTGPDSTSTVSLVTDPWTVTVASVGPNETGDIRDIKGPLAIPRNWLLLLPWVLVVGALGGGAYWLQRRIKRRPQQVAEATPTPAGAPHEVAYEMLDRLAESGLLEQGEIKAYYIAVSEIVRRYIAGRYGVDALEMATYEVLQGLEAVGVSSSNLSQFDRFLDDCDLVKFAKYRPEIGTCREIVARARNIVTATRLVEPQQAQEMGGAMLRGGKATVAEGETAAAAAAPEGLQGGVSGEGA